MGTCKILAVMASALLVACAVDREPTALSGPSLRGTLAPQPQNQRHGFSFLPPLVSSQTISGTFDPRYLPYLSVEVCLWQNNGCQGQLVARFTSSSGKSAELLRIGEDGQEYIVNWQSWPSALQQGKVYHLRVIAGPAELGYVELVVSKSGLLQNASTGNTVAPKGKTLPVKFAIQNDLGGVGLVGREGGEVTSLDGAARLILPPGALSTPTIIAATTGTASSLGLVLPAELESSILRTVSLEPTGTTFLQPARLEISAPQDAPSEGLGISQYLPVNGLVLPLPSTTSVQNNVSTTLQHLSTYFLKGTVKLKMGTTYYWQLLTPPSIVPTGVGAAEFMGNAKRDIGWALRQWQDVLQQDLPFIGSRISFAEGTASGDQSIGFAFVRPSNGDEIYMYRKNQPETEFVEAGIEGWDVNRKMRIVLFVEGEDYLFITSERAPGNPGVVETFQSETVVEGVALHEVGHHLGLDDIGNRAPVSIMASALADHWVFPRTVRCSDISSLKSLRLYPLLTTAGKCAGRMSVADPLPPSSTHPGNIDPKPRVRVTTADGRIGIPDVVVVFSAISVDCPVSSVDGCGTLSNRVTVTDVDGYAILGEWTLNSTGTYTVHAYADAPDPTTITTQGWTFGVTNPQAPAWVPFSVSVRFAEWYPLSLTGNRVNNVFSLSASNVYVSADGGQLFRSTDGGPTFNSFPPGMSTPTYQVWGTSANNLYAVSWYGTMKHWDGTSWTDVGPGYYSSNNALYRVWGSSASDVYGVGDDGMVWHFNGTTWAAVDVAPVALQVGAFQGVWGSSGSDVFIGGGPVGRSGRDPAAIYHFDGSSWQSMPLPASVSSLNLGNIWGTGPNDVYAVASDYYGTAGALLHYDGSAWSVVLSTPVGLTAVGGTGVDTRYVVGIGGAMYVKSGSSWAPVNTGTTADFSTIYFTQDGTGWAGGADGVLLKKLP